MDILFEKNTENDCYFFSYANLNIDLLSIILNRERNSFIYQNGKLDGYARIFCEDENNNIIASVYEEYNSNTYGIVVKITKDELEILKSHHKNYTCKKMYISYTSSNAGYEKIIKDNEITHRSINHICTYPYMFVYNNNCINDKQITPSIKYINEIRNMLNDRKKIEDCKTRPIKFHCVKHMCIEKIYKDDYNEDFFRMFRQNKNYSKDDIHIIVIGYEEIDYE